MGGPSGLPASNRRPFLPRKSSLQKKPSFRKQKGPRRQSGREPFWGMSSRVAILQRGSRSRQRGEDQRTWANTESGKYGCSGRCRPNGAADSRGFHAEGVSALGGKIEIDLHGHGGGGQRDAARPLGHDGAVHMPAAQAHPRRTAQDIGKAAHILEGSSIAPMPVTNGDGA